jgi:hypothetical protein
MQADRGMYGVSPGHFVVEHQHNCTNYQTRAAGGASDEDGPQTEGELPPAESSPSSIFPTSCGPKIWFTFPTSGTNPLVFPHNSFALPRRTGERFSTPGLVDVPAAAAAVAMGKKMIKGKYFSKMGGRHIRTLYSTVVSRAAEGGTPGDGGTLTLTLCAVPFSVLGSRAPR